MCCVCVIVSGLPLDINDALRASLLRHAPSHFLRVALGRKQAHLAPLQDRLSSCGGLDRVRLHIYGGLVQTASVAHMGEVAAAFAAAAAYALDWVHFRRKVAVVGIGCSVGLFWVYTNIRYGVVSRRLTFLVADIAMIDASVWEAYVLANDGNTHGGASLFLDG